MRENVVHTTAVNIHVFTKMLHTDAGALNMPSRISDAPRTVPLERLILELGLGKPKHKVILILLILVFLNIITYADLQLFLLHRR